MTKIIAVSGYFNPIHKGHIRMFREASSLGVLVVILNTDEQVKLKGSIPFMSYEERKEILESIRYVTRVIPAIDKDQTVCMTLKRLKPDIFCNGGDQKKVPEEKICNELGIKLMFNVGGEKVQSSSKLLKL